MRTHPPARPPVHLPTHTYIYTQEHQKLLTEMEKLGLGQIPEYLDQLRAKLQ